MVQLKTKNNSRMVFPAPRTIVSRIFLFFFACVAGSANKKPPRISKFGRLSYFMFVIYELVLI